MHRAIIWGLTLCASAILLNSTTVNADFILAVNFINYTNPSGLCAECNTRLANVPLDQIVPVCCDQTSQTDNCVNTGEESCDTRFRWTMREFNTSIQTRPVTRDPNYPSYFFNPCMMTPMCPFSETSRTFDQGPVGFLGRPNPYLAKATGPWMGRIQFFIEPNDGIPSIIDSIVVNLDSLQLGAGFTEETTYTGYHNISHMRMSFKVKCSPSYCGPDCTVSSIDNPRVMSCASNGQITCANGYDPVTNCSACNAGYDPATNCSTCLNPNLDASTSCTTCFNNRYNIETNCSLCLSNRDLATTCSTCLYGWDSERDCTECIPGRNLSTNCTTCLSNRDLSTNCVTCLLGWDSERDCTECLAGRNLSTNCTTCLSNRDLSTNCVTCLLGWDSKRGCTECLAGWSMFTNCTTCLPGYSGDSCLRGTVTVEIALVGGVTSGVILVVTLLAVVLVVIAVACTMKRKPQMRNSMAGSATLNANFQGNKLDSLETNKSYGLYKATRITEMDCEDDGIYAEIHPNKNMDTKESIYTNIDGVYTNIDGVYTDIDGVYTSR